MEAMKTSQCKCGHWAIQHTGPGSECWRGVSGTWVNPAGVKMRERKCECREFRPSERSWWRRRVTEGTEERGGYSTEPVCVCDHPELLTPCPRHLPWDRGSM